MKVILTLISALSCLASAQLRIVSYNIKHGEGMDGKIDLARIAKVISAEKPDLVALQEVDKNCQRSGSIDQAKELGNLLKMEPRFAKFMDFQGGEYGMAVLSRFPIEKTIVHKLPDGAEPRIALEVIVRSPAWPGRLSFVGIHNDWTKEPIRVRQVTALTGFLKERKHPVILAGDFNAKPASDSLELLKKDSWKILRKGRKKTFPSVNPRIEIDFFFVKGLSGFSYKDKVTPGEVASDHCPISVVLSPEKKGD